MIIVKKDFQDILFRQEMKRRACNDIVYIANPNN